MLREVKRSRRRGLRGNYTNTTKTEVHVPIRGSVPPPARRAQVLGPSPERAAPQHSHFASLWSAVPLRCQPSLVLRRIPIPDPLPCVAVHVEESPRIGLVAAHLGKINVSIVAVEEAKPLLGEEFRDFESTSFLALGQVRFHSGRIP